MLSLLLALLLAWLPAQAATWGSSAERTRAEGSRALLLPDGDVLVLRAQAEGRYAVERWSEDQQLRWRTFFEIPARRVRRLQDGATRDAPLFELEPSALLSDDLTRAIGLTEDELRVFDAYRGQALAFRFALADGAQARQVLYEGEPEEELQVLAGGAAAAVVRRGEDADAVLRFDPELRPLDTLPSEPGWRYTLDDQGRLCGLGADEATLELRCLSTASTEWQSTLIPKGEQPASSLRFVPDGPHHGYVTGLLEPTRARRAQLLIARVHVGAAEPLVVTRVGLERMVADLTAGSPRYLVLRGALVNAAGDLVLHGQFVVPEIEQRSLSTLDPEASFERWALTNSARVAFEYRDIVAFAFSAEGGLRWTAGVHLYQRTHAETSGDADRLIESAGYTAALMGDRLRLQYVDLGVVDLISGATGRRVLSQDIQLSDGAVEPARELLTLGPEEQYLRALSMPIAEDEWLISFRVRMRWTLPDTTLLGRVGAAPEARVPMPPASEAARGGERYLTGQLLGFHEATVARDWRPALLGAGLGAGGASSAAAGAWFALGLAPGGCCVATAVGCGGCAVGVGLARVLGGKVAMGPAADPELLAGYADGYRRGQRTLQARWAFVGGVSAVAITAVVASSGVMGRLQDPLSP